MMSKQLKQISVNAIKDTARQLHEEMTGGQNEERIWRLVADLTAHLERARSLGVREWMIIEAQQVR
jgi:hypothetical protein